MINNDAVYEILTKMIDLEKLSVEELKVLDNNGLIVKVKTDSGWKYQFNHIGIYYLTLTAKVQLK